MSIATRLGNRRGQRHVGEQAEAGGAYRSEHGSHAELCPSILLGVHPWRPARPSKLTSQRLGGTTVATHRQLPEPSRAALCIVAHMYASLSVIYYFTEVVHHETVKQEAMTSI